MNTDKSQEANLLAETLRKNGIACCATEAMEKANQIISKTVERKEDKTELNDIINRFNKKSDSSSY